jgi:aryl-alcohol dehydrogenase-like predicted oxidoreductase
MEITVVGVGSWAVGGGGWSFGWGSQDDEESIAALRHAIESGVNWIDTAAAYGAGHAEEVVARALDGISETDRPYVFTKGGVLVDPSDPYRKPRRVAAPASLRREIEGSLRRLNLERIDLYQVHWPPDDGTPIEAYWATMLAFKDEGLIRAAGLSNHSVPQLEVAEAIGHVDTLQPPLSAIRREASTELAWCSEHHTGVIIYAPMQSGLLTGSFSVARVSAIDPNDWRSRDPEFSGERLQINLAIADALAEVAARRQTTTAAVAVAWTLAWPGVTGAIVGARRAAQVDGWLPAATIDLSDDELDHIARAIERTGAGGGPARPPVRGASPGPER